MSMIARSAASCKRSSSVELSRSEAGTEDNMPSALKSTGTSNNHDNDDHDHDDDNDDHSAQCTKVQRPKAAK